MTDQQPEELRLLDWPNTSGIIDTILEKLQHSVQLRNDYAILSTQEATAAFPDLRDVVNDAMESYHFNDLLDQLMSQAQDEIAETVIDAIGANARSKLTSAILQRNQEKST